VSGEYHLEELAAGVYARLGSGPIQPNCGFIVGDDEVTLFDTTYSPAAARAIAADVARVTARPIGNVVISHHHWDHAWGTQVFSGARVIGHVNTRTALLERAATSRETLRTRADAAAGWMCVPGEQFAAELDELQITLPTLTFTDQVTLWAGGREIQLRHFGAAHTDGDTLLYLPAEGIVFGGDVVCNRLIPVLGDGDPVHFGTVLQAVAALEPKVVLPGHGALGGPSELEQFARCLAALCAEVAAARANGAADAAAALDQVRLAEFADWAGRDFLPGSVRRIWDSL
jgi:glyoxylase-like metal-dependent hydrolase (beta-lactamase superfamily II)